MSATNHASATAFARVRELAADIRAGAARPDASAADTRADLARLADAVVQLADACAALAPPAPGAEPRPAEPVAPDVLLSIPEPARAEESEPPATPEANGGGSLALTPEEIAQLDQLARSLAGADEPASASPPADEPIATPAARPDDGDLAALARDTFARFTPEPEPAPPADEPAPAPEAPLPAAGVARCLACGQPSELRLGLWAGPTFTGVSLPACRQCYPTLRLAPVGGE